MPADKTFRLRGATSAAAHLPVSEVAITSASSVIQGAARGGAVGELEMPADAVVRVVLANGFVLWSRADDLLRERGRQATARSGVDGAPVWEVSMGARPGMPTRGSARGRSGLDVKLMEVFGVDLKEKTARELAKTLEDRQLKAGVPGLYHCPLALAEAAAAGPWLTPVDEGAVMPADAGPILVFLHGTGSSCSGSFGKLWAPRNRAGEALRGKLLERYGERVFALEHRTLTESPIANALALARALPAGAEIHLVSHSRGGLVGELMCLGQRDSASDPLQAPLLRDLFAADRTVAEQLGLPALGPDSASERDKAYEDDRKALLELLAELDARKFNIRRFVRVACPARGTTLASGRLDRWLSVVDFLSGTGLFGECLDFLLAVVKQRTDPRVLPGIEAMMPGSALTRLLQHPDLSVSADLSVIAGDIEGETLGGQLKLLAVDWFYGADHDLVVNTGSMFGGLRRSPGQSRFLRDVGADVNHFNYFTNEKSVKWLLAGLTRADGSDGGFQPLSAAPREAPRWRDAVRRSRAATTPRPIAVVLPGTMGSVLKAAGDDVWLNYWRLLRGGLDRIGMGRPNIEATDLLDDFYGPLLEFLARSHRVEIFPYDWRMSVRDAALRLVQTLEPLVAAAERSQQPVHLVAHSMGGLVVRAMIADGAAGAALWRRITALPNSRFMMLGTPNAGSHEAVRWLVGENATELKLALLDFTRGTGGVIDIVRRFPGLVELLPFAPGERDFSDPELWRNLRQEISASWATVDAATLRDARQTWQRLLAAAPDPDHMVYVAGRQPATVTSYWVADADNLLAANRKRMIYQATARGDGTVTWASGQLPGVPMWFVDNTAHDALCSQRKAFPGYLDLLMTGKTRLLADHPPAGLRGEGAADESFVLPDQPFTDDLPDENAVNHMGFGGGMAVEALETTGAAPVLKVSVSHCDLAYSRHAVLVGHYLGDAIVSAEGALDRQLNGALSRRQQLGLYPTQLGTHSVFFHEKPDGKPGGAVVVGLGQVGELSPGLLAAGVSKALLDYALQVAQWPDDIRFGPSDKPRHAALSCLLVGSGAGGMPIAGSVEAILRAAVAAGNRLVEQELDHKVVIDEIEFIEVFEDVAIVAAEALSAALRDDVLAARVSWPDRAIRSGTGGRRRVRFDDQPDWWQRLEIIQEENQDALRFIFSTDRARAEETLVAGQLTLADSFIAQAVRSSTANAEVAKTLFEMLLPNRLKELAPQESNLVLLVDKVSARYPWELLEDRWSASGRPPAVAGGLVRQLKTPHFRPHPAHSVEARAFVVGNPDLSGWDIFPDLPGALEEAETVASLLRSGGFNVRDSLAETVDSILCGLHADAWRILHLAGHGEHEYPVRRPDGSTRLMSGMVIGKEVFLTPGDVEQMRWVPELVFINCCHLGQTLPGTPRPGRFNELAANLAIEFVNMGVKAVVAAGWAVDDSAASAFASVFYTEMLAGQPFGCAVRTAREAAMTRFPGVNTWGAYQCYGDPGYRLRGDGSAAVAHTPRPYFVPSELLADLDNHRATIRMKSAGNDEDVRAEMQARIGELLDRIPANLREAWLMRADVAAAVGTAWGETGAWANAVEWLERALLADEGDCPVRVVEQCANFQVRLAGEEWTRLRDSAPNEPQRAALVQRIEHAIMELDLICTRAPTSERLSLLGSACKRLAWVYSDEQPRREALLNMSNYYQKAGEMAAQAGRPPLPYSFTNAGMARVLAARIEDDSNGAWRPGLLERCTEMAEISRQMNETDPHIWNALGAADCELLRLVAAPPTREAMPGVAARIAGLYRDVLGRGASPRERASVLENLDFVIAMSDTTAKARRSAGEKTLREALGIIRSGL